MVWDLQPHKQVNRTIKLKPYHHTKKRGERYNMGMDTNLNRRSALKRITAAFALCGPSISGLWKYASAMGKADTPQGMHRVEGDVRINGMPAKKGDIVSAGDLVATGANSMALFVCQTSAYMMREKSRLIVESSGSDTSKTSIEPKQQAINLLRVLDGKLLSVFGAGSKTIETPSAYIGIRGTGVYLEVDMEKTYICTCYGKVTIRSASDPKQEERITTRHHESPRYIYAVNQTDGSQPSTGKIITSAPMVGHTDAELTMLEALVNRKPPFAAESWKKEGSQGGY